MCLTFQYLIFCVAGLLTLLTAACQSATVPEWHWERAEVGLSRQTLVSAVAIDSTNNRRMWAGIYAAGGFAASNDGGQTWTIGAEGLGDNPIFDLLAPPHSERRTEGELWVATRDGLLYSLDAGQHWQPVKAGLPAATAFALDVDATGRLYVGLDDAGVYAEAEAGDGWVSLALAETLTSAAVISLDVSADGRQLYAGTAARGVFASSNGGQTWIATYPGHYATNVVLNPANPQQAVASLRDRLVRTHDGGQSWHTLSVEWAQAEIVSLLWLPDGTLGAGTGRGHLFRSVDGGESWQEGGTGLVGKGGILDMTVSNEQLLVGSWTGIYASQNGGETWQAMAPSLGKPEAQALLATDHGLLLGTRHGLFRWQAADQQWQTLPVEFPPGGLQALAIDPADPTTLYAGTTGDGLYRSVDGGQSWQGVPSLGVGVPALSIDPGNSDHLYILAAWERVYESKDGGQNWSANWDGLGETLETVSLVVDNQPVGKTTVYVGAETGLYRRQNNADWELVAPSIADQSILALLVQPTSAFVGGTSILYLGTTRGIYRSLDQGQTVQSCTHDTLGWGCGLENISVTALLVDPAQPRHLYAGTAYNGVYQSLDNGQTWQPIGPADLADDVVESLAWGPTGELFVAAESGVWWGVVE